MTHREHTQAATLRMIDYLRTDLTILPPDHPLVPEWEDHIEDLQDSLLRGAGLPTLPIVSTENG